VRSPNEPEKRPHLPDEQFRLLESREVTAPGRLVPVADIGEVLLRPSPGRPLQSLGKMEQPTGTSTVSTTAPEIHSFTCRMLSQYSRAEEAPVPGSQ
jgi:hypothetical protein